MGGVTGREGERKEMGRVALKQVGFQGVVETRFDDHITHTHTKILTNTQKRTVVWVGDPEQRWRSIRIEKTLTRLCQHTQVVNESVPTLDTILNKERMSQHIVEHVVLEQRIVYTVRSDPTIERVMNTAATNVRRGQRTA